MKIHSNFENCGYENPFLAEEFANSKVELVIELEKLVSVQSKKSYKIELINLVNSELIKFKWIIYGAVSIEFHWYLSGEERQEMDKSIDLDNLTKPLLDSLTGANGLIIDDSQLRSIYSEWITKNELYENKLRLWVYFNNEETLNKDRLFFVRYWNAMCFAIDLPLENIKNLFFLKILISMKLKRRNLSHKMKINHNVNVFLPLVFSPGDFHITRLARVDSSKILSLRDVNNICVSKGLSIRRFISEYKLLKLKLSKNNTDNLRE